VIGVIALVQRVSEVFSRKGYGFAGDVSYITKKIIELICNNLGICGIVIINDTFSV
jgi:hypothetical protein